MKFKKPERRSLSNLLKDLFIFKPKTPAMHVRISQLGHSVLHNSVLANKIADAIVEHKDELEKGYSIKVDGYSLHLTASLEKEVCEGKVVEKKKSSAEPK